MQKIMTRMPAYEGKARRQTLLVPQFWRWHQGTFAEVQTHNFSDRLVTEIELTKRKVAFFNYSRTLEHRAKT